MGAGAPIWPLRRLEHEGMGAQHLQIYTLWAPRGTFSTGKTVNQALQHLAKKRHRKGTAWPATGATGRWVADLGEAESSGRLGASWKEDKQGVRIWGQAESTVRSQLSWLLAHSSSQLVLKVGQVLSILVGASHPHPSLFCPNSFRAESALPLSHM